MHITLWASCRTYSFLALIVLLRCPPEQLSQQGQDASGKFSDLVVKCLIKLTKALQSTLDVSLPTPNSTAEVLDLTKTLEVFQELVPVESQSAHHAAWSKSPNAVLCAQSMQ